MGQTLVVLAERTASDGGPRGKIEQTEPNNVMLNKFIEFLDSKVTGEMGTYQFASPMSWPTTLTAEDLSSCGCTVNGEEATSETKSSEGQPMLVLKKVEDVRTVTVMSLEQGNNVLNSANSNGKKTAELRRCLEANNDPVAKICGERFSTIHGPNEELVRYMQTGGDGQDDGEREKNKTLALMLTSFHQLDRDTMREVFSVATSTTRLTHTEVDMWVELLRRYCGKNEDKHILEELDYWPEYKNKWGNGCRALPKRQIHGEICYIVAVPHDTEAIYITATTEGYIISPTPNNSTWVFGKAEGEETTYKALMPLLRAKSPKFNELVDNEEIFQRAEEEKGIVDTTGDLDGDNKYERGQDQEQQKRQKNDETKTEKKKREDKKKKLEPSLKWKNLSIEEHKEKEKKAEEKKKKLKHVKKHHDSSKKHTMSDGEDSFSESSSESEEEEETPDRRQDANTDLPSEYWQIQKLVKYLKCGNQTATIIALCSMRDFNLAQETCQLAIRDVGGLEVLINLLDTDEIKCKIGSLKILKEISKNTQIRRAIADLGGLQTMVKILQDPMANKELRCLVAETIANVAKFSRARRTVRQHGGIKKLVGLLDIPSSTPSGHGGHGHHNTPNNKDKEKDTEVACSGAMALWSCSKSKKNKQAMRKAGSIPLLAKLLKSDNHDMLIPVVGTLQECASEPNYRLAIRTEGMVEDLVKNLKEESPAELQMHCASAIFKCAEEKETRNLVREYGGLDPLVALLDNKENKELLAAATGAIWKCAISPENVVRFQELKAIDQLVTLLSDQPEEVLVNVVGALAELAKDPPNRMTIRKAGGIQPLVNLLTGTNQALLINVTRAVGRCAEEPDNMLIIDKLDGVRLLWSLLKNENKEVKASAAWAICPCIENAKDAGEMVRSFVGGLELIVGLLHLKDGEELDEHDIEVLASVCAAIANIANDEENLAVITDHNVVSMLSKLTNTTNDRLRQHLAEAIARCCNWGQNRIEFGNENAVAPLVRYLKAEKPVVHRSTAKALFQLSKDPDNCITMHEAGVVKPLMEMVGSDDAVLQEAAAGCIANIRRLALANEKAKNK